MSAPPVGEAEELGSISSSEKLFARGRIKSRERAGEVGKPAFKLATLAQLLVSGSTGNTFPCSPGKTCSLQGKATSGQGVDGRLQEVHPLADATSSLPQPAAEKRLPASPSALKTLLLSVLQHWCLLWPFLEEKGLSHLGLIQPGLASR